jgi:hypothetical protein
LKCYYSRSVSGEILDDRQPKLSRDIDFRGFGLLSCRLKLEECEICVKCHDLSLFCHVMQWNPGRPRALSYNFCYRWQLCSACNLNVWTWSLKLEGLMALIYVMHHSWHVTFNFRWRTSSRFAWFAHFFFDVELLTIGSRFWWYFLAGYLSVVTKRCEIRHPPVGSPGRCHPLSHRHYR